MPRQSQASKDSYLYLVADAPNGEEADVELSVYNTGVLRGQVTLSRHTNSSYDISYLTVYANEVYFNKGGAAPTVFIGCSSSSDADGPALVIDQGSEDGPICVFRSSDIAHGMTSLYETDVWGCFSKKGSSYGGIEVLGITEAEIAIDLVAYYTTDDTGHDAGGEAAVMVTYRKKSGTTVGNPGANANLFGVCLTGNATRFLVDEDGDVFSGRLVRAAGTSRPQVEELGVVGEYKHGVRMISTKRHHALVRGALLQLNQKIENLERIVSGLQ